MLFVGVLPMLLVVIAGVFEAVCVQVLLGRSFDFVREIVLQLFERH